jgi:outer membrane protein assembly factor BamB
MKKTVIAVLALMMAATFAVADEHGGPGGPGPGGAGPGGFEGPGESLNVAPDGTVIITRAAASSTAANPVAEIAAIRNGAVVWTSTLPSRRTDVELSGSQVIEVYDGTATGATTPATTLKALSVSDGTQAWTLNVTGRVSSLTPFNGGTYAVVTVPAATSGGTATRSLVAISSTGTILWTVAI